MHPDCLDNHERGDIKSLYFGARVLVTGATGFIGKVLLESLLRKTEVDKIYILIRSKKNKTPEERLKELLKEEIFTELEKTRPERLSVVVPVHGDVGHPSLDLSPEDADLLEREVDIVFHIAATVRLNENLKVATELNLRGTKLIMDLARRMVRLKVIIHCSSAYTLDFHGKIEEKIYPAEEIDVIKLMEAINNETARRITKEIIGKSGNTYFFTKRLAENLIDKEYRDLPIGIVRPGLVVSAVKDPLPGYIDNMYGPTYFAMEIMTGRAHCMGMSASERIHLLPVDFCCNALIAAAWDTFRRSKTKRDTPVYNVVPGTMASLNWAEFMAEVVRIARDAAPSTSSSYPFCFLATSWSQVFLITFFFHYLPAAIIDYGNELLGQKSKWMKTAKSYEKSMKLYIQYSSHNWTFHTKNLNALWKKMSRTEQELFPFSFEGFDWKSYIEIYMDGIKRFLMHSTIPKNEAQERARRHFIDHCCLVTFILDTALFGVSSFLNSKL